jgi:hypothetical protein
MIKVLMQLNEILYYFKVIEKDSRLNVWHVALLIAILYMALQQGRLLRIKVSRSLIMCKSHVNTVPTYHKYFKELQELGYICYRPSYHPGVRSEIDLLKKTK